VSWAFYDERFDSKLFEIWTLSMLFEALSRRFGAPVEGRLRPLWLRDDAPQATFRAAISEIELHYQRDASGLGLSRRWGIVKRDHRLGAIPDIVIRIRLAADEVTWMILDCKLRRHRPLPIDNHEPLDLPTDEIYKVLGYFEHLDPGPVPIGSVVYYTPGVCRTLPLERSRSDPFSVDGLILLAGIDPAADGPDATFDELADQIGRLAGEPSAAVQREAEDLAARVTEAGGGALEALAAKKAHVFEEVMHAWAERHPLQREIVEGTTRATLRSSDWTQLDPDTRKMLVSAEVYAIHQHQDIDFSGPLLVLCAACEREVNLRLFAPLAQAHEQAGQPTAVPSHPTLGQALHFLRGGLQITVARERGQEGRVTKQLASAASREEADAWLAVADHVHSRAYNLAALTKLLEHLATLNKRYRRLAAHDAPVSRETWILGRGLVLGPDQLLHETVTSVTAGVTEEA
jgi:hypothetical protein